MLKKVCRFGTVVSAVPVVTDVLVSPSSVVTECYEDVSLDSDWDFVEPQFFSFSKKRSSLCAENQGQMSYEGSPVKATSRRRMMPPTPQQISLSSNESQSQADLEAQRSIWSTRERRVIAAMEKYLDESDDMKVEIKALELLMDPEDSEVCLRYILTHARRRGSRTFRDFFAQKRKLTTLWPAETAAWSNKEKGRAARKVAKRFARRRLRRNDDKGSSVRRKKDEDAAAAAEFFVNKGGRKPVEFCGR